MGRKVWDCCAPFGGGSSSNTMWPEQSSITTAWHLDPSSLWPQQTWPKKIGEGMPSNMTRLTAAFWFTRKGTASRDIRDVPPIELPSSGLLTIQLCC